MGQTQKGETPRQPQQGVPQSFPEADLQASRPVTVWGLHSHGPASPSLLGPREY